MNHDEIFLHNIALCTFFHKRNLCNGICINCPHEVMRTISFQTQGELFETFADAISSSFLLLSKLEKDFPETDISQK